MALPDLNPVLLSRLRRLVDRRKNYLYERDDMHQGKRKSLLQGINYEIVDVIDRSLKLVGVRVEPKRAKGYRVRKVMIQPTRPEPPPSPDERRTP